MPTVHSRASLMAIDLSDSLAAEAARVARAWRYLAANGLTREDVMSMTLDHMLDIVAGHQGYFTTTQKIRHIRRAVCLVLRYLPRAIGNVHRQTI